MEGLAREFASVKFVKANIAELDEIAAGLGVMGAPTLVFFKDGQVANQLEGLQSKPAVKAAVEKLLAG